MKNFAKLLLVFGLVIPIINHAQNDPNKLPNIMLDHKQLGLNSATLPNNTQPNKVKEIPEELPEELQVNGKKTVSDLLKMPKDR